MIKKYLKVAFYSVIGALLICGCTQKSKNTTDSQKGFEQEAVDTLHILEASTVCMKPLPMDVMCCSTSGISAVVLADSQSLSYWKFMTE